MQLSQLQRSQVPFSQFIAVLRRASALSLAAALIPAAWAQDSSSMPSAPSAQAQKSGAWQAFDVKEYSKPTSPFPNLLAPYTPRHVSQPSLANSSRLDDLMRDGKIYISLNDAVALALENNLDIAIARYNLNIADTDIWRAKAGASILGVNSGVVQNTPGGGVGGLGGQVGSGQGGTSVASGGAGAGAGGLVVSTLGSGSQITSFDPILTGTVYFDRNKPQCSSSFCLGDETNTTVANFGYTQGFQTGTTLNVSFNNSRVSANPNSHFYFLFPTLTSSLQGEIRQHLLQGFGLAANTRFIKIANNDRKISDVAFRLQITTTVDQIENMYWDLVYAYENVRVQQENLSFAKKTLGDTQKQVEIGTLAPIEVVRAQSTVASDQQTLTVALTNLQLQQLLMKNALSRTLVDPRLADAEVIPTSIMEVPAEESFGPIEDLVNSALTRRPELEEARINLSNNAISNKAVRNALLPSLDAFAYYVGNGVAGGYQDALGQLVDSTAPDKGVGLQLTIPIRNRVAQATQTRSEFEYRQAQLRIQQLENQIRIDVRNARFGVQQNRASVAAAQAAVDSAKQSLDAEQKKYALGASTSTLVLQNEAALFVTESTLLSAKAAYQKAQVELDRATGVLLEHANIEIADAVRGQVTKMPAVPHVVTRPADQPMPSNPPQQ